MIRIKRVYDPAETDDGTRFLVERLWPRGIKKENLRIEAWLKDVAPSTGLRRWFGHDPAKWDEFRRRYAAELAAQTEALRPLRAGGPPRQCHPALQHHDTEHNSALVLKSFLAKRKK